MSLRASPRPPYPIPVPDASSFPSIPDSRRTSARRAYWTCEENKGNEKQTNALCEGHSKSKHTFIVSSRSCRRAPIPILAQRGQHVTSSKRVGSQAGKKRAEERERERERERDMASPCFFTKNLGAKLRQIHVLLRIFLFETFEKSEITIFLGSAVVSKQNKTKLRFTAKRRKLKTERKSGKSARR